MKRRTLFLCLAMLRPIFGPNGVEAQTPPVDLAAVVECYERLFHSKTNDCTSGVDDAMRLLMLLRRDSPTAESTLDQLVELVLTSEDRWVRGGALTIIGMAGDERWGLGRPVMPRLSVIYWNTPHLNVRSRVVGMAQAQSDKRSAVEFLRTVAVDEDPDRGSCTDCPAVRSGAARALAGMGEEGRAVLDRLIAEGVVVRDTRGRLHVWTIPAPGPAVDEVQVFGDATVKEEVASLIQEIRDRSADWVNFFTDENLTDLPGGWATEVRGARTGDDLARVIATTWGGTGRYTAEYYMKDGALLHVDETFEYFETAAPALVWRNSKGIPAWERGTYFKDSEVGYAEARGGWGPTPGEDGEALRLQVRQLIQVLEQLSPEPELEGA